MPTTTFWITSTFPTKDGSARAAFAFLTDEAATVEGFVKAIQAKGIVYGEKLVLEADDDVRIIRRRTPLGLAAGGVASIQLFEHRVIEIDRIGARGRQPS